MCVDYCALNKITIKNRSGDYQIRIVSKDIHKTAFCTTFGLFKYLFMPFVLINAPTTFNKMMDNIFRLYRTYIWSIL